MSDLSTSVATLQIKNPIMPASGTFSDDLAKVFDLDQLGAHVLKTITPAPRRGNPVPRVSETPSGMLNSIGIPSKGADYFIKNVIPLYASYEAPLVVSISADTADDFADLCRRVSLPSVAAIEVNISCPNIEEDGHAFAMHPDSTLRVMQKLRAATDLPLWAKLSPNTSDIAAVAKAAEIGGADALVVANTILGMAIDIETYLPSLGNIMGGLSGPAIKPIFLRMVYQCHKAVEIPIIGCGGISSAKDVIEYLLAGASAVQVGTATFTHPEAMPTIIRDLEQYCQQHNIDKLSTLIGQVRDSEIDHQATW